MALPANTNRKNTAPVPSVRVRTRLVLDGDIETEIVSFDNLCEKGEHVALIFPQTERTNIPLVRLHSECLTGDVFGSAHCDCGDQLHEAKNKMEMQGGMILYLRQEGRGIGLYNKLDAYKVQNENGLDTFEANKHIGFEEDQRSFKVAAEMLKSLGIEKIRILTNNPDKVAGLQMNGITITEIIPTGRYEKKANARYLDTKKKKGHAL